VSTRPSFDSVLSCLVAGLCLWFFASSLSIAFHKAPQHDDAMFATIPKNSINGYGWATSYSEKIPFNPDISTGPTLLLPAAAVIAVFGNQGWVPAITGAIMNIALVLLILAQLRKFPRFAANACALLFALSLFAVNDFKTFTGYYTTALLFIAALLFALDRARAASQRFFVYGISAAIGLYGKPLILLSFMIALPMLLVYENRTLWRRHAFLLILAIAGFLAIFLPWQLYRLHVMTAYPDDFRLALDHYGEQFFSQHGSGFAQIASAQDKLTYIKLNAGKNFRLLSHYLQAENGFPFFAVLAVILLALAHSVAVFTRTRREAGAPGDGSPFFSFPVFFPALLGFVITANIVWYVVFSFAMTPGHSFFLVFFSFLLLFVLLAQLGTQAWHGLLLCVIAALCFPVRLPALVEAYSFHAADIIDNAQIAHTLDYLEHTPHHYPLASCGYQAAPYRLEYLLPQSQNFVDCYNVLQDNLARDPQTGNYHWTGSPDFTFAFETLSLLSAAHTQGYVLEPLWQSCQDHLLFHEGIYVVCDVPFDDIRDKLDPTETAKQLVNYQRWYRTRIKAQN